jgi:hypothetical protein
MCLTKEVCTEGSHGFCRAKGHLQNDQCCDCTIGMHLSLSVPSFHEALPLQNARYSSNRQSIVGGSRRDSKALWPLQSDLGLGLPVAQLRATPAGSPNGCNRYVVKFLVLVQITQPSNFSHPEIGDLDLLTRSVGGRQV